MTSTEENPVNEPTSEQCTANSRIPLDDGRYAFACWYPTMGGYVSHALVVPEQPTSPTGCFTAYVWHDGEFPFEGGDRGPWGDEDPRAPVELHHCSAEQFVEFGQTVGALQRDEAHRSAT